jgi:signal transduction histidine kinase
VYEGRVTLDTTPRLVSAILAFALLYFLLGWAGLQLAGVHENVTLIWAPTGLALGALVVGGWRLWPGVFLGAIGVNLLVDTAVLPALGIAFGNTAEALVGWALLVKVARFSPRLARTRDVLAFIGFGVLGCTLISATVGLGVLWLSGSVSTEVAHLVWLSWWLGDAGGALVVAPIIFVAVQGSPPWTKLVGRPEALVVLLLLIVDVSVVYSWRYEDLWQRPLALFSVLPLLTWAGLRLGPRGGVAALAVVAVTSVLGTSLELGPIMVLEFQTRMVVLWAYIAMCGSMVMIFASTNAERREAERGRGEAEVALQRKQRLESLGVLAGGVAHDFNNLLAVIRLNAHLALDKLEDPEGLRQALEEVNDATTRAAGLCDQLLTYAGKSEPALRPLQLDKVVADLARLWRSSLPKNVELKLDLDEPPPTVRADDTRMQQVAMNLVLNAAEAIGDAPGEVIVRVRLVEVGDNEEVEPGAYVLLEVEDDGEGMTEDVRAHLFDPFFTTKFHGRGLGLAGVHGIVSAHGGAVRVRSELGRGTTMRVYLPPDGGEPRPAEKLAPARPIAPLRILLADDDKTVLNVTRRLLELDGHHVRVARDGEEAVAIALEHSDEIDLAILDVAMPRLDGPGALRKIHERLPDLPALLVSGYDEGQAADPTLNAGFLRKPFDPDAFRRAIAER